MTTWYTRLTTSGLLKRTPQLAGVPLMAGGFLYSWGSSLAQRQSAGRGIACVQQMSVRIRWERPLLCGRGRLPLQKQHQLGAAGWDLRCGTWLPAAQGTPYSTKRQGFLPGRTGLNPLDGIPLATRGLEEFKPSSLRPGMGIIKVCDFLHELVGLHFNMGGE